MEAFLEETLDAIPDSVLDAPILQGPSLASDKNPFAKVRDLLPPPYEYDGTTKVEELSAAAYEALT